MPEENRIKNTRKCSNPKCNNVQEYFGTEKQITALLKANDGLCPRCICPAVIFRAKDEIDYSKRTGSYHRPLFRCVMTSRRGGNGVSDRKA